MSKWVQSLPLANSSAWQEDQKESGEPLLRVAGSNNECNSDNQKKNVLQYSSIEGVQFSEAACYTWRQQPPFPKCCQTLICIASWIMHWRGEFITNSQHLPLLPCKTLSKGMHSLCFEGTGPEQTETLLAVIINVWQVKCMELLPLTTPLGPSIMKIVTGEMGLLGIQNISQVWGMFSSIEILLGCSHVPKSITFVIVKLKLIANQMLHYNCSL